MTETPPSPKLPLPVMLIGLVLMLLGVLGARYFLAPHQPTLASKPPPHYLQPGKPIADFALIDYNKRRFDLSRLKGKWTFLYFGYTNCPDVCPTTMLIMKSVWSRLPAADKADPTPQMVFVTVDPGRDTPERLKKYVRFYQPDFLGVTGKMDEIDKLTKQVGVAHSITPNKDGKGYSVQHGSQIILVDPNGDERAVFSPPHKVAELVNNYVRIRHYYNQRMK